MEVRIALLQQIIDAKRLCFDINRIYKSVKTCCCRYRYLHTAIQNCSCWDQYIYTVGIWSIYYCRVSMHLFDTLAVAYDQTTQVWCPSFPRNGNLKELRRINFGLDIPRKTVSQEYVKSTIQDFFQVILSKRM